jgi:predicted ATP-dependent endonuclease of OLD family
LGTSIFELISEHNILFEGLTDKKLFDAFTHKYRIDIKPLDINTMSVDGESHFDKYCKFFNNKSIRGYVVADADTPGVNAKTRILRDNANYTTSNTFDLNDIVQTGKGSSLEDLLPVDMVQKSIADFAEVTIVLDASKTLATQLADFNKNSTKKVDVNKLKTFICDTVCNDITKSSMTKDKAKEKYSVYYEFVTTLHQRIKDANASTNGQ